MGRLLKKKETKVVKTYTYSNKRFFFIRKLSYIEKSSYICIVNHY